MSMSVSSPPRLLVFCVYCVLSQFADGFLQLRAFESGTPKDSSSSKANDDDDKTDKKRTSRRKKNHEF